MQVKISTELFIILAACVLKVHKSRVKNNQKFIVKNVALLKLLNMEVPEIRFMIT